MTALSDSSVPHHEARVDPDDLIASKAWDLLGLTREEFIRAWWAREFDQDTRPEIGALDQLMRTGRWDLPEPT